MTLKVVDSGCILCIVPVTAAAAVAAIVHRRPVGQTAVHTMQNPMADIAAVAQRDNSGSRLG